MDPATIAALRDFGYPAVMSFALLFMLGKNLEAIRKELAEIKEIVKLNKSAIEDIKDNTEPRSR